MVRPTRSMSSCLPRIRTHFWMLVARGNGGRSSPEEVRDELVHPGVGEQRRPRVVRDQPGRGHEDVLVLLEEVGEGATQRGGIHVTVQITTPRPAPTPGAAPPRRSRMALRPSSRAARTSPGSPRAFPVAASASRPGRYRAVADLSFRAGPHRAPIPTAAPAPNHRARRNISLASRASTGPPDHRASCPVCGAASPASAPSARAAARPGRRRPDAPSAHPPDQPATGAAVPARRAMTLISGPENARLRQPGRRPDGGVDGLGRADEIVDPVQLALGSGHGHLHPAQHH